MTHTKTSKSILIIIISAIFLPFVPISCDKGNIVSQKSIDNSKEEIFQNSHAKMKRDFALALAKALKESPSLRTLIKKQALKMFDKDYDVLYQLIKNKKLSNDTSVNNFLEGYFMEENRLYEISSALPLLTIFVPNLPKDIFSAESWNIEKEIPAVAVTLHTTNKVPIFKNSGELHIVKKGLIPGFPVVVVKENERVVTVRMAKKMALKGNFFSNKSTSVRFKFLSANFNGIDKNSKERLAHHYGDYYDEISGVMDLKIEDASLIYENHPGWQRDYVYYNIKPSDQTGSFTLDFQEQLVNFSLNGPPDEVYDKIADQVEDPKVKEGTFYAEENCILNTVCDSAGWTEGYFEFKVQALINAQNGVGQNLVTYFPAKPEDLFYMEFKDAGSLYVDNYYTVSITDTKSLRRSGRDFYLPLFSWNLDDYASSIKIKIEEKDRTVNTIVTVSRSAKFATNFEITAGQKQKVGLKFGASASLNLSSEMQIEYTEKNDRLGAVIINFGDDILLKKYEDSFGGYYYHTPRTYSTGWYKLEMIPVPVQ